MRGYFEQEQATRQTIDEAGWLHSGDIGVLERDGTLRITGRLKNMVIRGGENLYPAEIEVVLREHPDVLEAAVFGVPDERMGEELGAWIRLREGARAEPAELREFVLGRLARFKAPRYVWLVDELPMTVTGKVQKFRMREIAIDDLGLHDATGVESA
jgi:fatty-acyl-CoA synthase